MYLGTRRSTVSEGYSRLSTAQTFFKRKIIFAKRQYSRRLYSSDIGKNGFKYDKDLGIAFPLLQTLQGIGALEEYFSLNSFSPELLMRRPQELLVGLFYLNHIAPNTVLVRSR